MVWALAGLAAGLASAYLGKRGQEKANEQNARLAFEQMQFQERMSSSSYQRAVEDLRAAGLNPMLAVERGGASTPGGATAQMQNEVAPAIASAQGLVGLAQGIQAVQSSQTLQEQMRAETDRIRSITVSNDINTAKAVAEAKGADYEQQAKAERVIKERFEASAASARHRSMVDQGDDSGLAGTGYGAEVRQKKADAALKEADIPARAAEAEFYKSEYGQGMPWLRAILSVIRGMTAAR